MSGEKAHSGYMPQEIETRRQAAWQRAGRFRTPPIAGGRPSSAAADAAEAAPTRKYIKPSAPFTSGNIHIGHVRSYSIGDAYARFSRARGQDVLFAFGFDAFGLPAELGAIAAGVSPSEWVQRCARKMTAQLQRLGFSFDWERSFMSSDAVMYRWSQWLFITFLQAGLIHRGTGTVDWCDHCETTLASIQVEDGACWRCHNPVRLIQRPEWFLRISAHVPENDMRLQALADSGIWDENALGTQRFVLGRVDGVELELEGDDGQPVTVFTPHADAVRLARFVLVSPKHPEVERFTERAQVRERLEDLRSGGMERAARDAESIAVIETGCTVTAPDGGAPLPVLISPLVDGRYGTTAVLGIPERDGTDAVIAQRLSGRAPGGEDGEGGPGAQAGPRPAVRYRAGDFSISRQRSWGTPIPIVYCDRCGTVPVPREQLPVELPREIRPTGAGNPLAELESFLETECPACGGPARRETDTLDCHFDALWLWVPACVPQAERERTLEEIFALEDLRAWLPSERVVAGSDSGNFVFDQRIVTKALRDIGPLAFLADGEPFAGCLFHEMVVADGRKMSKHLGNVVEPDELVAQYGADTVRLAVLYAARPQKSLNWTDAAVQHCHRFLHRLWEYSQARFAMQRNRSSLPSASADVGKQRTEHLRARLEKWCDAAIERSTADMAELETHSAVRNVMRLLERIQDFEKRVLERRQSLSREDADTLVAALATLALLLAPFAPHVAEQLWIDSGAHGRDGESPAMPWPQPGAVRALTGAGPGRAPSPAVSTLQV